MVPSRLPCQYIAYSYWLQKNTKNTYFHTADRRFPLSKNSYTWDASSTLTHWQGHLLGSFGRLQQKLLWVGYEWYVSCALRNAKRGRGFKPASNYSFRGMGRIEIFHVHYSMPKVEGSSFPPSWIHSWPVIWWNHPLNGCSVLDSSINAHCRWD